MQMLFKTLHSDGSDVFIHVDGSTSTNRLPHGQVVFSERKEDGLTNVISKTNKVKWTADVIRTEISWCNSTAGTCGLARMRPWADQRVIFAHWPSLAPRQSSDSLSLLLFSLFHHSVARGFRDVTQVTHINVTVQHLPQELTRSSI